jgi:hypothetical protein
MSEEFTNKNLDDSAYLDVLYGTFFDRAADEGGKSYWQSALASGQSRGYVLAGFVNSDEFTAVCDRYGIERGTMSADGTAQAVNSAKVRSFVERMYTKALNREGEEAGINDWTNRITSGSMSAEDVAKSFFASEEFSNRNLSNDDYVETLYQTFMDRASDAAGKADWVGRLNNGADRNEVLEGFSRSEEFAAIMNSYGLGDSTGSANTSDSASGSTGNANTSDDANDSTGNTSDGANNSADNTSGSTETEPQTETRYVINRARKYGADGELTYYKEYKYDAEGKLERITYCHLDGSKGYYEEYECYANGNKLRSAYYDEDGILISKREYDEYGNITKNTLYKNGYEWWWVNDEYEYDANGNVTKGTYYYSDGTVVSKAFVNEHDANGYLIQCTCYNADGNLDFAYKCEYDADGNRTKETFYNADGNLDYIYKYEYDAYRNRTKETFYNADGSINYWEEYEYTTITVTR